MVQRQELLERLLAAHEGYFDVEDTFELVGQTFQGRAVCALEKGEDLGREHP